MQKDPKGSNCSKNALKSSTKVPKTLKRFLNAPYDCKMFQKVTNMYGGFDKGPMRQKSSRDFLSRSSSLSPQAAVPVVITDEVYSLS